MFNGSGGTRNDHDAGEEGKEGFSDRYATELETVVSGINSSNNGGGGESSLDKSPFRYWLYVFVDVGALALEYHVQGAVTIVGSSKRSAAPTAHGCSEGQSVPWRHHGGDDTK